MIAGYGLVSEDEKGYGRQKRSKTSQIMLDFLSHLRALCVARIPYDLTKRPISKSTLRIGLILIATFAILCLSYTGFSDSAVFKIGISSTHNAPSTEEEAAKTAFIESAMTSDINGLYDPEPLTELCAHTTWTPGLVFGCDAVVGGIGNVMDLVLNCVRFAIEAGADLIIPEIEARDANLIDLYSKDMRPLSYMFDTDVLITSLAKSCPQMTVHSSNKTVPNLPEPVHLKPLEIVDGQIERYHMMADPAAWRGQFENFLEDNVPGGAANLTRQHPAYVMLYNPLLMWPTLYNGDAFRKMFGRILPITPPIRKIAAKVSFSLSTKFNLNLDMKNGVQLGKYVGAHLRTAADAMAQGWMSYEEQSFRYLEQTKALQLSILYVASGSEDDIERLRANGLEQGITVLTKRDLLSKEDIAELNKLTWDQQGLVDFELMVRSSYFVGIDESSFAWLISLKRGLSSMRTLAEAIEGKEGQAFSDERSWLWGPVEHWSFFPRALWP